MSSCCRTYWKSNRWRNITAIFCYSTTLILTLVLLIATSTNVSKSISWANFDFNFSFTLIPGNRLCHEAHTMNIGLITSQHCWTGDCEMIDYGKLCENVETTGASDLDSITNAGRGVITANVFGMFFALCSVFLLQVYIYMPNWAAKLKFPRLLLFINNFLMLMMFIVSIATWFKLAQDRLAASSTSVFFPNLVDQNGRPDPHWVAARVENLTAGYAIAVNIFIICLSFFAWAFTFMRVQFPNSGETSEAKSVENVGMMSQTGHAISMQYQPPPVTLSPSQAMGAYQAYNNMNSPPPQKRGGFFN